MTAYQSILMVLTLLVSPFSPAFAADPSPPVNITLGDINDDRSTGAAFSGLKIELKLNGDAIFDADSVGKPVFTSAMDDTGRQLVRQDKMESLLWDMQPRREKSSAETLRAELANPTRRATMITLRGMVPVYLPSQDPSAIVTLPNLTAVYGRLMESKDLHIALTVFDKASYDSFSQTRADAKKQTGNAVGAILGMALGGSSMKDNELRFRVRDPDNHLVRLEVVNADGKVITTGNRYKTSGNGEDIYTYSYENLPQNCGLRIYYATPKSLVQIPFRFDKVALP